MTSVSAAIRDLKNAGVYFVVIKAKDMPNGVRWTNFAVAGNMFVVYYCRREGIVRTQALARQILLFVFYGFFTWVTRERKTKKIVTRVKPVIFFLAKTLINGRSRLANGVEKNFSKLIALLKKDPSLRDLLLDNGEGHAPMEYLIAVEEGLRAYSNDIHAMGTKPLRSRFYWGHRVDVWRKREGYIALCRHVAGKRPAYPQWDCFLYLDYVHRQQAGKTFMKRHLPLSDGEDEQNFNGEYDFDWEAEEYSPKKRVKLEKKQKRPSRVVRSSDAHISTGVMVFDVEKGCMVPM